MPGWKVQSSSLEVVSAELLPHERLLHVVFGGMGASGSSLSSSNRGSGVDGRSGGAIDESVSLVVAEGLAVVLSDSFDTGPLLIAIGFSLGPSSSTFLAFAAAVGVSSTVECLPVVQGGIDRNSSKVRTRGLQHIQPSAAISQTLITEIFAGPILGRKLAGQAQAVTCTRWI